MSGVYGHDSDESASPPSSGGYRSSGGGDGGGGGYNGNSQNREDGYQGGDRGGRGGGGGGRGGGPNPSGIAIEIVIFGCKCGKLNFARVECNKCGAPAPPGGGDCYENGDGGGGYNRGGTAMDSTISEDPSPTRPKWRKVAYGGMQPGFDDNHTDETFLEDMVMNASFVKRSMVKVMQDSVSISQYICVVALVVWVWIYTLKSSLTENTLLVLDLILLGLGFLILVLTGEMISLNLLLHYFTNISFFTTGLYVLAPIYQTLTRSISSDSISAVTVSLLILHLFLHDYSGPIIRAPSLPPHSPSLTSSISLNASVVASVFIASRLPSRVHVFAILLFSLQVFLFSPLVIYCMKRYSFQLHLWFSFGLMGLTLTLVYILHPLLFILLLSLLVFVTVVCPYWLIRIQEYKFEINGPWDEAKLCFDITE